MRETTALARVEAAVQLGTLQATSGAGLIEAASKMATPLKQMIDKTGSAVAIPGRGKRPYVMVEGWTTLAGMCGVTPRTVSVESKDGVYTAVVELRTIDTDHTIGRATAECGGPEEPVWAKRVPNARLSMAQTRATGKACRMVFSWVMVLAGYEPTPYEEMETVIEGQVVQGPAQPPSVTAPAETPSSSASPKNGTPCRVLKVAEGKTAGGNIYWDIGFDRAVAGKWKTVRAWDPEVAELAKEASTHEWPVEPTCEQNDKGYWKVAALEVVRG